MAWKVGSGISGALVSLGVLVALVSTAALEEEEVRWFEDVTLAERTAPGASSATLTTVSLRRDQRVVFELCAADPMDPERWAGAMAVAVSRPSAREVLTRSELDARVLGMVRRDATSGCLTIGSGTIGADDDYTIEASWDAPPTALADVPLRVRVLGRRPLGLAQVLIVLLTWIASLGLLATLALRSPSEAAAAAPASEEEEEEEDAWVREVEGARRPLPRWLGAQWLGAWWARLAGGFALVLAGFYATGFLPGGAAAGLAIGAGLASFEVGVALLFAPGRRLAARLETLGLRRPRAWWAWFPGAVLFGLGLVWVARLSTTLVPSTGTSAVQTFVSWPSGMLSFAALAVVAPLAEEIFFRGFVYGLLEPRNRALAFLGGWLLFVLAHVPQTFGQWGALVAITVTGLMLTTLRVASRSTLVSGLAHLVYNGLLALSALG